MKKLLLGLFMGVIVGLFFGTVEWKRAFNPFSTAIWGISPPDIESHISNFHTKCPQFSSSHFFFRAGGPDVDEYWSFVLPPDQARVFLDSYIKKNSLLAISQNNDLPIWITQSYKDHKDWRSDLWYNSLADLSEAYTTKGLFCGYSAEKNRIYLINWDDF
jgi:hypothetical protein